MLNIYGETHKINGYRVEVYPMSGDRISYYAGGTRREAKINLCRWARGLHGNPPGGTQYGSARLVLPDGSRATLPIYV